VKGLPNDIQQDPDFQRLKGTLTKIQLGIGTPQDPPTAQTLLGGLKALEFGLRNPGAAENCLVAKGDSNPANDCGATDAVEFIAEKLQSGSQDIQDSLIPAAQGNYQYVAAAYGCDPLVNGEPPQSAFAVPGSACFVAAVSLYGYSAEPADSPLFPEGGLRYQSALAAGALTEVVTGLDERALPGIGRIEKALYNANCDPTETDPTAPDFCGISQALGLVNEGIDTLVASISTGLSEALTQAYVGAGDLEDGTSQLANGTGDLLDGTVRLEDGASRLANGAGDLSAGSGDLLEGVTLLDDGALRLSEGSFELLQGAGLLDAGATRLADGTVRLDEGASDLSDGSGQLFAGMEELYAGLIAAASGSTKITDGLDEASSGAPEIRDGASRLSEEGTKQLIDAGSETAVTFGERYATLTAGAERAEAESMAYGAPEGAQGLTAYTYEIRGEEGEGEQNWSRGLIALAIFAAGTGLALWRRSMS
jgi:putative membrane protein